MTCFYFRAGDVLFVHASIATPSSPAVARRWILRRLRRPRDDAGVTGVLLGWRPNAFWQATPAELATVLNALRQAQAGLGGEVQSFVSADDLERLMEMFPDG